MQGPFDSPGSLRVYPLPLKAAMDKKKGDAVWRPYLGGVLEGERSLYGLSTMVIAHFTFC